MFRRPVIALATVLLVAGRAHAQEPQTPKELKDAQRFIASAMLAKDTTEKRSRLERALNPLQQALAKYPDNARVWLEAGEVYAKLHDYVHADSAFDKAEKMYPGYAQEIMQQRLTGWGDAFEIGISAMNANDLDTAMKYYQLAELMYGDRPETKLNIAVVYSSKNDRANAISFFRSTVASAEGPLREKLGPDEQAAWKRYAETARIALADIVGREGIEAYNDKKFDLAMVKFREALSINPQSRDHAYNLVQSIHARANELAQSWDALRSAKKTAEADAAAQQLAKLYTEIEPVIETTRQKDPNSADMFVLLMRSYQVRGDLTKDAAQKAALNKRVNELLKVYEEIPVEIGSIAVPMAGGDITVKGALTNLKMTAGAPVKIHFTLLGYDGSVIGEGDTSVNAPAVKASAPFEITMKASKDIAGWKYTVTK
ncbi:MAG TPA: hypothetical protein VM100_13780 [Longimicrobiales bacterium]|nr:hypothetical protein [Longimicrobiales bacterium]